MSNQKLDPEFKAKWVKALRSGEYEQGAGALLHKGKYDPLGVACQLIRPKWINQKKTRMWPVENSKAISPLLYPIFIEGKFSISCSHLCEMYKISKMNDKGKTFLQIADYIESNL